MGLSRYCLRLYVVLRIPFFVERSLMLCGSGDFMAPVLWTVVGAWCVCPTGDPNLTACVFERVSRPLQDPKAQNDNVGFISLQEIGADT
jgi:hypothetical protein